jgi:hypothetical protein
VLELLVDVVLPHRVLHIGSLLYLSPLQGEKEERTEEIKTL